MIMVQLDLEKVYDCVNWSFILGLMHTMSFGSFMFLQVVENNLEKGMHLWCSDYILVGGSLLISFTERNLECLR